VAIIGLDSLINSTIHYPRVYGKDTATNEAAGICHTPWYQTGITGAGAAPTGGLNGANFVGPVAGQISSPAALSGAISYLSKWTAVHNGGIGHLWLIDRLWGNVPVVTTTGAQAITQPTLPSRDETAATVGGGVFLALEVSSTTGNAGAITNSTASYTSSAGTAGRTATLTSFPITGVTGTWVPFSLVAGDLGVRSVQSVTLGTSYVSGAVHLTAWRLVASMPVPTANTGYSLDFAGLNLPAVWDSSVLQLVYFPTGTTVGAVSGELWYSQA
jgi:hypothetical protein